MVAWPLSQASISLDSGFPKPDYTQGLMVLSVTRQWGAFLFLPPSLFPQVPCLHGIRWKRDAAAVSCEAGFFHMVPCSPP